MTWPSIIINQLNQRAGTIDEVERVLLYVGYAAGALGDVNPFAVLNAQSDIDDALASADVTLRENVRAGQLNAGQNWQAYALMLEPSEESAEGETPAAASAVWRNAVALALEMVSVEGVVLCTQIADVSEGRTLLNALQALRSTITAKLGRWVWFIATVAGPKALDKPVSWADYLAFVSELQTGIAANAVQLVPSLWGNEAGVLAGRLSNRAVTVADSPARVETGALLGLGIESSDLPVDGDGVELSLAYLQALHDQRLSVPMWYPDYEGMYWGDGRMLEVTGGDYSVIEYLRIMDKASRRVRVQAIGKIANRNLNSTPSSIETHQTYFGRVLREMSRTLQINGTTFPGDIQPPADGAVLITWESESKVSIGITLKPYTSPKQITVNMTLDTALEE